MSLSADTNSSQSRKRLENDSKKKTKKKQRKSGGKADKKQRKSREKAENLPSPQGLLSIVYPAMSKICQSLPTC